MANKMTDDEIIEILEICVNKTETFVIHRNANTLDYDKVTIKDILGVINRQKADLKLAENINHLQMEELQSQKAEIERLQKYHDDMEDAIYSFREDHAKVKFFKNEIKAEAVKEFAERLKKTSVNLRYIGEHVSVDDIDNLLKEMVGEDK